MEDDVRRLAACDDGEWHILGDVAKVLDLWLETPVPLVLGEERVLVKEAAGVVSDYSCPADGLGARLTQSRTCTWRGSSRDHHT